MTERERKSDAVLNAGAATELSPQFDPGERSTGQSRWLGVTAESRIDRLFVSRPSPFVVSPAPCFFEDLESPSAGARFGIDWGERPISLAKSRRVDPIIKF
jgi:hypothetical protein